MRKLKYFSLLIIIVVSIIASEYAKPTISAEAAELPALLSIGVAPEGTVTYILGVAFGNIIQKYTSVRRVVSVPTGGTPRWVALMNDRKLEFGLEIGTLHALEAYNGIGTFKEQGPQPLLALMSGHEGPFGLSTTDPNVKTVYDLKGKRFYYNQIGNPIGEAIAPVLLEVAGLKGQVKLLTFSNIVEAAEGLRQGKADAVLYIVAVTPLLELARTKGLYAVAIPKEVQDKVKKELPWVTFTIFKAGYAFATQDTPSISLNASMAVREDLDPTVTYTILSTILGHYDDYKDVHTDAKQWTLQNTTRLHFIPYHPGAIKYYKEKGMWTDEMEKRNRELIAKRGK